MAGRPRGSTNTTTRSATATAQQARSGTSATQMLFKGTERDWLALPLSKGGFAYLMLDGGDYQPIKGSQPQQAQMICDEVLLGHYIAIPWTGSVLANRSIPRDTTNAIPIDSNQNGQTGTAATRRVRKRVSGSRTPVTSSSS